MYSKEQILTALRQVIDPDLKNDIVTLGMVENLRIEENKVGFQLVLTTPACPLKGKFQKECIEAIHQKVDPNLIVEVEMISRVTSKRKKAVESLSGVKNIIAIASGKGGVGKSTIAANLAVALARTGASTGLLDADIYGPSQVMMFGLNNIRPGVTQLNGRDLIEPVEKYDVKILSIGFFVDPDKALIWRGPMASGALTQLFTDANWGVLDYLVIDMPPGTGDIHLTLVQQLAITGVAVVTTPQEVALADARKALDMYTQEKINVPILGIIENMSYFTPAELPNNKYYIFGKEGGRRFSERYKVPLLGKIPLVQSICESSDKGNPIALDVDSPEGKAFDLLAANIARAVAIRNDHLPPTHIVEIFGD